MRYICQICGYIYDDEIEGIPFEDLPDSWTCPMCKAPKGMFEAEGKEKEEKEQAEPIGMESDLEQLSPGALAALFSNLARGAEKQYKGKDSELFMKIAAYFADASPALSDADIKILRSLIGDCVDSLYPKAKAIASDNEDRGALRSCVWGEKVERMIQAILARYEEEGEAFLEGNEIWVCSICGFVYIGETPPPACPVCKVPDWKFEKIS